MNNNELRLRIRSQYTCSVHILNTGAGVLYLLIGLLRAWRNKLRFTWGWAEVLSMAQPYCSNVEQVGLTWALLSVPIMCISGDDSDGQRIEGELYIFWPIAFSHLQKWNETAKRGARPKDSLRWQELRSNTVLVHRLTKNSASVLYIASTVITGASVLADWNRSLEAEKERGISERTLYKSTE
jgi:hypothetical protein